MKYSILFLILLIFGYTSCRESISQSNKKNTGHIPTDSLSFTSAVLYVIDSSFYPAADTTWDFPNGEMAYKEIFGSAAFIDSTGYPIHKHYQSYQLSPEQMQLFIKVFSNKLCDGEKFICMTTYRDVLVFYDASGKVTGQAQICFGCSEIAVYPLQKFNCQAERTLDYTEFQKFIKSIKYN